MKRLFVLTYSAGFKHDYLPFAVKALKEIGEENGFKTFVTEDYTIMDEENLKEFSTILFITSGNSL